VTVPRVLLLVLALLHATGIDEVMRRACCEAGCERNGCENDCPPGDVGPGCPCHCPSAPTATPPAVVVQPIQPPDRSTPITFEHTDRPHPSPDPREILHVPRSSPV
jgi:hypothetical protein